MSRTLYPRAQKRRQQRLYIQDQKRLSITPEEQRLLDDCRGKPFWVTNHNHKDCCFNCIIGWPRKDEPEANNVEHPIYDYEIAITEDIETYQHIWIKKSRGLGITEIVLRYLAWCCLSSDYYKNKFIHIIAGTREDFANKLIVRLENIFQRKYPDVRFQSKYTELWLNQTLVQIYPSKQLKDLRGHIDVSFMFIDEADYFDRAEQEELPYVIKSYEEKSNAKVLMVSTPNRPDGLFAEIEHDLKFKGFFHKLQLGYEVGLDKIYNRKFIEREKLEPEFEREYNLKYLGKIGNVFSPQMVDDAVELGEQLKHLPVNQYALHFGGIDPGFSKFTPVYIGELDEENQCVRIVWHERYDRYAPSEIVKKVWELHTMYTNLHWFIDGSNRGFINELKLAFEESQRWEKPEDVSTLNRIIPVNFGSHGHERLLEHLHSLLSKRMIAIPADCTELITALKTAKAKEWDLDKEETVFDDDLDSLRLLLKEVKIT